LVRDGALNHRELNKYLNKKLFPWIWLGYLSYNLVTECIDTLCSEMGELKRTEFYFFILFALR
jgi:hypothetical protein